MFLSLSSINCLSSSSVSIFSLINPDHQQNSLIKFFIFDILIFYLALIFINSIYLIIILPLLLLQIRNLKHKPRIHIEPEENAEIKVNYESIEMSDSGSMFLKSSSDWSAPSSLKLTEF